jgi:hypothetical protein
MGGLKGSISESGIGSSAVDLHLPGGLTGQVNFLPMITGILDAGSFLSGNPRSPLVRETDLPIAGASIGVGKFSAEASVSRSPLNEGVVSAAGSAYGVKVGIEARGKFVDAELMTPSVSAPFEGRIGALGFSLGAGVVPTLTLDGANVTTYLDLVIIGIEISYPRNFDISPPPLSAAEMNVEIARLEREFGDLPGSYGRVGPDGNFRDIDDGLLSRPGTLHPDPVSNPTPKGPAVNETRPGFSAPSPTGYAGRGVKDVEGPEGHGINRGGSSGGGRPAQESWADKLGGGGADSGSGGSRADVKTPPKNTSTGGNFGNFGGGNGGSENSGTHQGSAPRSNSSTGNGPGFSANTGPVNSGTGPQNTSTKSSTKTAAKNTSSTNNSTDTKYGPQPILLDLDGDGVQITELNRSTRFVDGGEGLLHRTAWAAAGNGVLFFDPDGRNAITEKRQYVFTEWNPTASGDLEALRSVWDSNGDGKLTGLDTEFAKFKVLVTNADGTTTVQTLTQLGITEINLTADTTHIELPDGSLITGQTTFTQAA